MTRKGLEKKYDKHFAQAGDTETDFYEWAIAYLINHLDRIENREICPYCYTELNEDRGHRCW
jgi:CCR4-NOT transcriptional regulation complex NOT5 subunit